jgi:hypothetical protein
VPKSRVRKTTAYTPPPKRSAKKQPSPAWLAPVMVACFLLGIAWLATYYITNGEMWGMRALDYWNLIIGMALLFAGLGLSTKWR